MNTHRHTQKKYINTSIHTERNECSYTHTNTHNIEYEYKYKKRQKGDVILILETRG